MYHWVGNSLLRELDYNDFFDSKYMIEYLKADFTESPRETSNTDNVDLAEEKNVVKSITAEAKLAMRWKMIL